MSIEIIIHRKVNCSHCDGEGKAWPSLRAEKGGDESRRICCPVCGGDGEIEETEKISLAEFRQLMAELEDED